MGDTHPLTPAEVTRLCFTVPGAPVPKGRPRFGRGRAFTPARTRKAESTVKGLALVARQNGPRRAFTGPIGVSLIFCIGEKKRGDVDNLAKLVLDACNGILWDDDSQVTSLCATRINLTPERTQVTVSELAGRKR